MSKTVKLLKTTKEYSGKTSGGYYVRKLVNGFKVYHQETINGKKIDSPVNPLAYPELGFVATWTYEQAKERVKALNKEKTLTQKKARLAADRLSELQSIDEILFPSELVKLFSKKLEDENQGTEKHLKKLGSHFLKVQTLCKDLQILPKDYKDEEKRIYKWFSKNLVSLDYTQKLIALLNRWGRFQSKQNGQFFEPISPVRGIARSSIKSAHKDATGVRSESKPLTPDLLLNNRSKLSDENYLFLKLTLWFGLRPEEAKRFEDFETRKNKQGTDFLVVNQTKLTMLAEEERLKYIPVLFTEQEEVLKELAKIQPKAPIYKTMRNVFGEQYGLYAGRKGFTDLMLSHDYKIEDISLWLGHSSIETTWAHYKNKNVMELPTPKKK